MLEFSDQPYEPVAPDPNRLILWLGQQLNRLVTLKNKQHKLKAFELVNPGIMDEVKATGKQHILFVANHSTHSDPQIMVEVQRQLGLPTLFMAAYDVFLRSKLDAWVMRKTGAFSVDRDGSDRQSMNTAVKALVDGEYGLTIFPEGNVYFMNDDVQPFMEGAAFMAMKAQKKLGPDTTIWAVPVAIKATHLEDQRETVKGMIRELATASGIELADTDDWSGLIKHMGIQLLHQRLEALGLPVEHLDIANLGSSLQVSAELVIQKLEADLDQAPKEEESLTDRIRKLRRKIHQIRLDPEREADAEQAKLWADHAMVALRIMSYTGDYLDSKPTLDRFAETCEKLNEDFTSEAHPGIGNRKAFVQIAQPIPLSAHLEDFNSNARQTLDHLTRAFEQGVQEGLDAINASNACEGAKPF
jgi:hypothetical protein